MRRARSVGRPDEYAGTAVEPLREIRNLTPVGGPHRLTVPTRLFRQNVNKAAAKIEDADVVIGESVYLVKDEAIPVWGHAGDRVSAAWCVDWGFRAVSIDPDR